MNLLSVLPIVYNLTFILLNLTPYKYIGLEVNVIIMYQIIGSDSTQPNSQLAQISQLQKFAKVYAVSKSFWCIVKLVSLFSHFFTSAG